MANIVIIGHNGRDLVQLAKIKEFVAENKCEVILVGSEEIKDSDVLSEALFLIKRNPEIIDMDFIETAGGRGKGRNDKGLPKSIARSKRDIFRKKQ